MREVIRIGLKRFFPEITAASSGLTPSLMSFKIKSTKMIELATAIPFKRITPKAEFKERVLWKINSEANTPIIPVGIAVRIIRL